MVTITNYDSGELLISDQTVSLRLDREPANRLVMAARMHTVAEFLEKLPGLLSEEKLLQQIQMAFEGKSSSERWNLKEKFARLRTAVKGYGSKNPDQVVETMTF